MKVRETQFKRGIISKAFSLDMETTIQNPNPVLKQGVDDSDEEMRQRILLQRANKHSDPFSEQYNEDHVEAIDELEVFDLIRHINDPEHPLTLEQLNVVQLKHVSLSADGSTLHINFTPTIPHCSMATLIGLSIRVQLLRTLPSHLKVDIEITPGTHSSEHQVNKQLNDKERVAAAMENTYLLQVVDKCLEG